MESTSGIEIEPLDEFFSAIRNPITRDRYGKHLGEFFEFLTLDGDLKSRARTFAKKAKSENAWATYQINQYMQKQKLRAERGEIKDSTLPNYYKPIKLFCEENDLVLNWKKISRRIPKGRSYANDRAPGVEEIKKVLSYPDRRI